MKTKIKKIIMNKEHELYDDYGNCCHPVFDKLIVTSYQVTRKRYSCNENKYYHFKFHLKDFFTKWRWKNDPKHKCKNEEFFNFKVLYKCLKSDFKGLKNKLKDIFLLDKNQTFYDYSYTGLAYGDYYDGQIVTIDEEDLSFEQEYCKDYKDKLFTFELED